MTNGRFGEPHGAKVASKDAKMGQHGSREEEKGVQRGACRGKPAKVNICKNHGRVVQKSMFGRPDRAKKADLGTNMQSGKRQKT